MMMKVAAEAGTFLRVIKAPAVERKNRKRLAVNLKIFNLKNLVGFENLRGLLSLVLIKGIF